MGQLAQGNADTTGSYMTLTSERYSKFHTLEVLRHSSRVCVFKTEKYEVLNLAIFQKFSPLYMCLFLAPYVLLRMLMFSPIFRVPFNALWNRNKLLAKAIWMNLIIF